jgi:hypothetical protein
MTQDESEAVHRHSRMIAAVLALADSQSDPEPCMRLSDLRASIKQWFRAMSQTFHPDRGGKPDHQAVINECHGSIIKFIQDWEKAHE